jgi:hypothetical protein
MNVHPRETNTGSKRQNKINENGCPLFGTWKSREIGLLVRYMIFAAVDFYVNWQKVFHNVYLGAACNFSVFKFVGSPF